MEDHNYPKIFTYNLVGRGGSRTSPRRGRQSLGGRLPNILVIFSEKPYEIKEILVRRGGAPLVGGGFFQMFYLSFLPSS